MQVIGRLQYLSMAFQMYYCNTPALALIHVKATESSDNYVQSTIAMKEIDDTENYMQSTVAIRDWQHQRIISFEMHLLKK